jgi:hypothetical protein
VVRAGLEALAELVSRVARVELVARVARVELVARVARAGLVSQVVRAGLVVPVALELNPVAELELDPVAVELAHALVAVHPKNKSATAARRRGLVRVPKKAEDTAAVAAATTREPVATEVAGAWVAAE